MNNANPKLIIGFITYGKLTSKYLPYFLPSLKDQTYKDFNISVVDNSEKRDNKNEDYIKKNYSEIEVGVAGKNLGFAMAYNIMIQKAVESGVEYFLVINPDVTLEPDCIEKMIAVMESNSDLGSVSPKILKWDFKNNKKIKTIDSCGIKMKPGLRFYDIGQGQEDQGQFNDADILGPSGAAALYRVSALKKIERGGQFFDELMFMYKEDCDLAYRLFLAGYRSKCVGNAVMYHDRSVSGAGESDLEAARNRRNKSRQAKKWSFLNQQIIFAKYWRLQKLSEKSAIIWYQIKILIFLVLFEQYLLIQLVNLWKVKKQVKIYKKTD